MGPLVATLHRMVITAIHQGDTSSLPTDLGQEALQWAHVRVTWAGNMGSTETLLRLRGGMALHHLLVGCTLSRVVLP